MEWLDWLVKHAGDVASLVQSVVVIGTALGALFAYLRQLREQGIHELIGAVVALVQDAKAQSWASDKKALPDVAGLVAKNLRALAASRGLGELSSKELEYATALASATHKANKLAELGYTGAPAEILPLEVHADPADPKAGPGN